MCMSNPSNRGRPPCPMPQRMSPKARHEKSRGSRRRETSPPARLAAPIMMIKMIRMIMITMIIMIIIMIMIIMIMIILMLISI